MNGEGLLEGLRFTMSCQVIAAPLHSWFTSGHISQDLFEIDVLAW